MLCHLVGEGDINLYGEGDINLYADSGATSHIVSHPSKISTLKACVGYEKLYVGDGNGLKITHTCQSTIHTNTRNLKLKNILVLLDIKKIYSQLAS